MKASEIFGLAIRFAGLFIMFYGGYSFLGALNQGISIVASFFHISEGNVEYLITWLVAGTVSMAIGLALLRFADSVVSFSYPGKSAADSQIP